MLQWVVFGGVWLGLLILATVLVGGYGERARSALRLDDDKSFDARRSHLVLVEISTQLFVAQILLSGIFALLIAIFLAR